MQNQSGFAGMVVGGRGRGFVCVVLVLKKASLRERIYHPEATQQCLVSRFGLAIRR